jgi:hypothetical protein
MRDAVLIGLTAMALVTLPVTMGLSCLLPGFYAQAAQKRSTPRFQQFSKHLFSTLGIVVTRQASASLVQHLVSEGVLTPERQLGDVAVLDAALRTFRVAGMPLSAQAMASARECVHIFAAESRRASALGAQHRTIARCLQRRPPELPECPMCSDDDLKALERDIGALPSRRLEDAAPPYTTRTPPPYRP